MQSVGSNSTASRAATGSVSFYFLAHLFVCAAFSSSTAAGAFFLKHFLNLCRARAAHSQLFQELLWSVWTPFAFVAELETTTNSTKSSKSRKCGQQLAVEPNLTVRSKPSSKWPVSFKTFCSQHRARLQVHSQELLWSVF